MATKKTAKSKAVKKSAPKKKSPAKKKSSIKKSPVSVQREVIDRDIDSSYEESTTPNYQPSVSEESTEKSGNPVFRFLIIAGLILIALIVWSQFSNKSKSTETKETTVESKAKPSVVEKEPETEKATTDNLKSGEYNLENIAQGKTLDEAKDFCKSNSLSLPSSNEFKSFKKTLGESIPKELEGSDFWTNTAGMAIKYSFASDKGVTAASSDKNSVLCKK